MKFTREVTLLVVLPLILMSMTLSVIGTSHAMKLTNINRVSKLRQEPTDIKIQCGNLCNDIKNLENSIIELEKEYFPA